MKCDQVMAKRPLLKSEQYCDRYAYAPRSRFQYQIFLEVIALRHGVQRSVPTRIRFTSSGATTGARLPQLARM